MSDPTVLLVTGKSENLRVSELTALRDGGFEIVVCSDSDNFVAKGATPLEAAVKAVVLSVQ